MALQMEAQYESDPFGNSLLTNIIESIHKDWLNRHVSGLISIMLLRIKLRPLIY